MQAPPPPPARIDLYSRSAAAKAFGVCLILLAAILAPVPALMIGAVFYVVASHTAGVAAGIAILLPLEWLLAARLLSVTRSAAWLDGSVLVVRTAFAKQRCDLARASDIALRSVRSGSVVVPAQGGIAALPSGRQVPVLSVADGPAGTPLRLRLVEPSNGKLLRAPALIALASALQGGQPAAGNPAADRHGVIAALHAMAASPKVRKQ